MVPLEKALGNMAQTTSRTGVLTTAPSTPVAGRLSQRNEKAVGLLAVSHILLSKERVCLGTRKCLDLLAQQEDSEGLT